MSIMLDTASSLLLPGFLLPGCCYRASGEDDAWTGGGARTIAQAAATPPEQMNGALTNGAGRVHNVVRIVYDPAWLRRR
jgi:hypothetical protein